MSGDSVAEVKPGMITEELRCHSSGPSEAAVRSSLKGTLAVRERLVSLTKGREARVESVTVGQKEGAGPGSSNDISTRDGGTDSREDVVSSPTSHVIIGTLWRCYRR